MTCKSTGIGCTSPKQGCLDQYGCMSGACPDFTLKRHDTRPAFKVKIEDCDGPLDLTGLVLEANMWAKAKLKASITQTSTYFSLADNIGFNQIMVGDIIIMDRARLPEKMLVIGFDENNRLVQVQRGYQGTTAQSWSKGSPLRIMKFMNSPAQTEMILEDILELNGTTTQDVLTESFFIYDWQPADTCLPGCYYLEFKLIKMVETTSVSYSLTSLNSIPSFTPSNLNPTDFGCGHSSEIEWIRRFPVDAEGFSIKIVDSPSSESNGTLTTAGLNIEYNGVQVGENINTLNFEGASVDDIIVDEINKKSTIILEPDDIDGGTP